MEYLKILEGIIGATAWPIAAVVIVVLLKKEVGLLLSKIKKIKHKDYEIEIQQELESVSKQADENNLPKLKSGADQERIYRLAADSPRGAILDSWLNVEDAIKKYCERVDINDNVRSPLQLIQSMYRHNMDYNTIGQGIFDMLEKLRNLRNEAVHVSDSEISTETAIEYSQIAKRVITRIEEA